MTLAQRTGAVREDNPGQRQQQQQQSPDATGARCGRARKHGTRVVRSNVIGLSFGSGHEKRRSAAFLSFFFTLDTGCYTSNLWNQHKNT